MERPTRLHTLLIVLTVGTVVFSGLAVATGEIGGGSAGGQGTIGTAPAASPDTVTGGETTTGHLFTFNVRGVSQDGSDDFVRVVFPDAFGEAGLTVNNVTVERVSNGEPVPVTSSPIVVDGSDRDGVRDTISVVINPDSSAEDPAPVHLDIQVNLTTTAPATESQTDYGVNASVADSDGTEIGPTEFATVTVEAGGTTPTPTPTPTATPTPTPTPTATPTPTPTATPTTATPATTATTTTQPSDPVTTTTVVETMTETEANGGSGGDDGGDGSGGEDAGGDDENIAPTNTPTSGSGPGFGIGGAVVAMVAMVAISLVALRRRD